MIKFRKFNKWDNLENFIIWKNYQILRVFKLKNNNKNKFINKKIESIAILIFVILKLRNIGRLNIPNFVPYSKWTYYNLKNY